MGVLDYDQRMCAIPVGRYLESELVFKAPRCPLIRQNQILLDKRSAF